MKRFTVCFTFVFIAAFTFFSDAVSVRADDVVVPLYSDLDDIGDQIEVIQSYYQGTEDPMIRPAFGIFDTGASVVTLSLEDQEGFPGYSSAVPIRKEYAAFAEGVGGSVTGHVSESGNVVSDGIHSFFNAETLDLVLDLSVDSTAAVAPGVQMFVGARSDADHPSGSELLPTISGTPILRPGAHGAAYISKCAINLDSLCAGLTYSMPDLQYVPSGTTLLAKPNATAPLRIPVTLTGEDNHDQVDLGDQVSVAPNPFVDGVRVATGTGEGSLSFSDKTFLFDTGAMMSLISTTVAGELGIDPNAGPTLEVVGAAGNSVTLHRCVVPLLELPCVDANGKPTGEHLQFTNAPVFVYDVGFGIDGILGMNLFNTAEEMLYDPNVSGASLQLTFSTKERITEEELQMLEEMSDLSDVYALFDIVFGHSRCSGAMPALPGVGPVPEPGAFVLLAIGAAMFVLRRFARRRCTRCL